MRKFIVYKGDVSARLKEIREGSVNCCVTSPPYFGLRNYGVDGQIGLEGTPEEYVAKLVGVFREVRRVLRDDGTLWLNLGDSYNAYNGNRGASKGKANKNHHTIMPSLPSGRGLTVPSLKNKDLIGIPWMVAFALRAEGWHLRQDIIWHKPSPCPESVKDRCTKAHEYLFLLSKGPRYYFDHAAMQEPAVKGASGSMFNTGKTAEHLQGRVSDKPRVEDGKRNRRDVWTVSTKPYRGAHFATFPPDLIEPCILSGSPIGGRVLDPFGGSGTTAGVSIKNGRRCTLCELNPDYVGLMEKRVSSICGEESKALIR